MTSIAFNRTMGWSKALKGLSLAALALLLTASQPLAADHGEVKNEFTGKTHRDLQKAIDEATSGDVLKLKGTFVGNFSIIDKNLTLKGDENAVLDGNKTGATLTVGSDIFVEIGQLLR